MLRNILLLLSQFSLCICNVYHNTKIKVCSINRVSNTPIKEIQAIAHFYPIIIHKYGIILCTEMKTWVTIILIYYCHLQAQIETNITLEV